MAHFLGQRRWQLALVLMVTFFVGFMDRINITFALPLMAEELATLRARHPSVGEVRGIGLFWVIELVKDRERRTRAVELRNRMVQLAFEHGLLLMGAGENTMRIIPPLVITRDLVDEGLAIFEYVLTLAEEESN